MRSSRFGDFGLIVANSHPTLGLEVAKELGVEPLKIESGPFPNGELDVRRIGDASGLDICIFSSLHAKYNTIKELQLICGTVKGSASRIFGVFPFVRDGKSDHVKQFGETVAYNDTAFQVSSSGLKIVAIFDQHSSQHPNSYDTRHYQLEKVYHIYLMRILIEYAEAHSDMFDSVMALDDGSFKRNKMIAKRLGKDVSFIIKDRDPHTREVNIDKSKIIGDVKGQRVMGFDDMIQKGSTTRASALIAKKNGAKEIIIGAVHNDFTPETFGVINPLLEDGTIDKIIILETIPLQDKEKWHPNMVVLSPATLIADVITRIHTEGHMRELFLDL
jgi:ribose-phosphate pyrophosphokinase